MKTAHPELLPALASAERLYRLFQAHPEAVEMYSQISGDHLADRLHTIGRDISLGNIDAPKILSQVETIERRLSHLAAPRGNWN